MSTFAVRTGLVPNKPAPARRYLWTDAFALCNFVELGRLDPSAGGAALGLRLVDQVHDALGRTRDDDPRIPSRGCWLSGMTEAEGRRHPTIGGLRIGKPLPERIAGVTGDDALEWSRDGQYFHYLTKWMHALDQLSWRTKDPRFNVWARELAATAFRAFSEPLGGRGLAWKMSTDLSRPLVASMGQHDPLDGAITFAQLRATACALGNLKEGPRLGPELAALRTMLADPRSPWTSTDLLAIGGLLCDAARIWQLFPSDDLDAPALLTPLLAQALASLEQTRVADRLDEPAVRRLGFRELGLSIGLHGLESMLADSSKFKAPEIRPLVPLVEALSRYLPLAPRIEMFWGEPAHRSHTHVDIDEVMLATSLTPAGFLRIARRA